MRRRSMGHRIELGAGLAAAVLAPLGLALLLFAPILPICAIATATCPASAIRYQSLLHAHLSGPSWVAVLAPLAILLAGAAGAIADARYAWRAGRVILGVATGLGLVICVLGTIGLVYLPAILALGLATYGAFLLRQAEGSAPLPPAPPDEPDA
jgi:hypothetical protein